MIFVKKSCDFLPTLLIKFCITNSSDYMYIVYMHCFSSTLVLEKKLVHVVYSKLDRDVLVIAMPAERCVN